MEHPETFRFQWVKVLRHVALAKIAEVVAPPFLQLSTIQFAPRIIASRMASRLAPSPGNTHALDSWGRQQAPGRPPPTSGVTSAASRT